MTFRDIATLVTPLAVPALHVLKSETPSLSYFGGSPALPKNLTWPERNGRKLDFLARLSLTEIQRALPIEWLPREGALLFFYDLQEQPWGFDPKDGNGSAVLWAPDITQPIAQNTPDAGSGTSITPHSNICFRLIKVLPSADSDHLSALNLNDDEFDLFTELLDEPFLNEPKHQVAGVPAPIQSDVMELECQLVSNGLYCGNATGYKDPRASELKAGAKDWKLLFQIDTDDDLEIMWGDGGRIYYWIKENEARQGNFSNTWVVLQCY